MQKVISSVWFTPMGGSQIGIVIIDNGFEEKAYIGNGGPDNTQDLDEQHIAETGAKFPLNVAKQLM
jgi:hypothetical protein